MLLSLLSKILFETEEYLTKDKWKNRKRKNTYHIFYIIMQIKYEKLLNKKNESNNI